jgi:phosphoribosylformylglycinamidine cyclo-ligase
LTPFLTILLYISCRNGVNIFCGRPVTGTVTSHVTSQQILTKVAVHFRFNSMKGTTSYKDAGVDVGKADVLINRMKERIQGTFNPYVLSSIGAFAALTEIPSGYKHPVLVTATDGVGTKLRIAFATRKHGTVGIDLVAMSVNDVLTVGARPYFFLDYFACGRLDERIYAEVITGICAGCEKAGCALVGGETAEMPSFYPEGEYDLAGFVTAFVEKDKVIGGSTIESGDRVIGLASDGLHSNGFSLARKIVIEQHGLTIQDEVDGLQGNLYEELLKPTRIYVKPMLAIMEKFNVKGMAHITGGGLPGNVSRIIPDGLRARLSVAKEPPDIFKVLKRLGNVTQEEMYATFNMGIGFVIVVSKANEADAIQELCKMGENAFPLGVVEKAQDGTKVLITSAT